jgi:LysM repeat protein
MQANGITNPNMVVAGQKLVLPGARSTARSGTGARSGSVTVQPGETLSEIADRQGVSLTRLMQANGITNPNMVIAGQKLLLPGARSTASAPAPRPLPTAPYTVKSGETLSEIADRFGTSTERLIQLNRISNPNMVVAGTRLTIPGRPSSAPAARNAKEHVVRSGESLSTIADSYGLPVEKLVAINKISDPNLVVSGSRLKLQTPPPVNKAPTKAAAKVPAKAATKTPAQAAAKPVAQPKPKPVETPAAQPKVTAQTTPQATPRPAAAAPAKAPAMATAQPSTNIAAATAATPQTATSKPASTATRAATTTRPSTTSKAGSSKPQGPDWRSYGPLQVDWSNWQPMGGSYVAPTLNGEGKPVYLAVNCGARKLNATSQSGQWKSWDAPQTDFEEQLVSDICKARTS